MNIKHCACNSYNCVTTIVAETLSIVFYNYTKYKLCLSPKPPPPSILVLRFFTYRNIIKSLDLRKRKRWKSYHPQQTALLPGAEEYGPGKEIAFLKILYAHCAESSPFVLKDVIARARGNIERMELYDQDNVKNKFDLILEKILSSGTTTTVSLWPKELSTHRC